MDVELHTLRDWAQRKLDAEHEASWATHRYLHLVALIDGILDADKRRPPSLNRCARVVPIDSARRRRAQRLMRAWM